MSRIWEPKMFCAVFWNIGGKRPRDGIVRLITALQREEDADVIALAECSEGVIGSTLRVLNPLGSTEWELIPTNSRVRLLLRGARMRAVEVHSHEYYSLCEIRRPRYAKLLLAMTHMVSRVHKEFDDVDEELGAFAEVIRNTEDELGHANTILLGDLNANPFANGVVSARGLHGIMPRKVAEQGGRQVSHRMWRYFFNPMWKFFGDGTAAPPGTCYYAPEGSHRAFHWNMYDQVLIRPGLLPYYGDDSVRIIHTLASDSLTGADWIPDRTIGSDHLPIRIRLDC
jgi:hypothetical protein